MEFKLYTDTYVVDYRLCPDCGNELKGHYCEKCNDWVLERDVHNLSVEYNFPPRLGDTGRIVGGIRWFSEARELRSN